MTSQPDYRKIEDAAYDLSELIHGMMDAQPGPQPGTHLLPWDELYSMSRLSGVIASLAAAAAERHAAPADFRLSACTCPADLAEAAGAHRTQCPWSMQ